MYILMISRGVPSAKDPQWGCFEQDQAEALQRNGHKVVVVSVDSRFRWHLRKIGITHRQKNGINYYNSFWLPGKVVFRLCGMKIGLSACAQYPWSLVTQCLSCAVFMNFGC